MFIIAGLGNPTSQYEGTRHNVGFEVIDTLADKYNIAVETRKSRALIGKGIIGGQKVILAKPQTYMNLSGESIGALVSYYKADEEQELLVIYDDISLDVGQLRISQERKRRGAQRDQKYHPPSGNRCVSEDKDRRWRKAERIRPGRLCAGPFLKGRTSVHGGRISEGGRSCGNDRQGRTGRSDEYV